MTTLIEVTDRIRKAVQSGEGLAQSIKLDLKGEGVVHVSGTQVSNDDAPADLVVRVSLADLAALGKGELDPVRAMMTGRLKVSDMMLAMRLQPQIQALFGRSA